MKTSMMSSAAVLLILAGATSSQAGGTLSSPIMWGGTTQTNAVCYVRNVGTSPITVTAKIVDENGVDITFSNACTTVAPGSSCALAAGLASNQTAACSATVSGSVKKVRAGMDIRRDSMGVVTILNQQDLR